MKPILDIIKEEVQNFNENFYKWFKQSKVVDRSGKPLRVYHGTQKDFDEFKSETGLMYFSKTPRYASAFATDRNIKRSVDDSQRSVLPVYLSIQKPLDLLEFGNDFISPYEFAGELEDLGIEVDSSKLNDTPWGISMGGGDTRVWQWIRFNPKYLLPLIKARGYDGIFMYENAETTTGKNIQDVAYVVFEPTQIKSATGNNGEFNPTDPDITKESIEEQLVKELSILTEEVVEGVADRYAERQFNIPDPNAVQDYQATQAMPAVNTQGEYVGDVVNDYNEFYGQKGKAPVESRIFANPKNLTGFDNHTRAISDINGNLFVAEHNGMFFHQEIEDVVQVSKYGSSTTDYMQWYRQGSSNMFTWSSTYSATNQFSPEIEQQYINALKTKNPQYRFLVPQTKQTPNIAGQNVQENEITTNEAFDKIVDGVADKYAEKAFNIVDPNTQMNQKAIAGIKDLPVDAEKPEDLSKGTLVGEFEVFDHGSMQKVPVYMNPRDLQDFDEDVKAVSNKSGDLFVAQLDLAFYHDDIINAVSKGEEYTQPVYNAYDESENVTWHRIGRGNEWGWSVSYKKFGYKPENRQFVAMMLQAVMKKNPGYRFIPQYWQETKQERYDQEHNVNNDSLLNYE